MHELLDLRFLFLHIRRHEEFDRDLKTLKAVIGNVGKVGTSLLGHNSDAIGGSLAACSYWGTAELNDFLGHCNIVWPKDLRTKELDHVIHDE